VVHHFNAEVPVGARLDLHRGAQLRCDSECAQLNDWSWAPPPTTSSATARRFWRAAPKHVAPAAGFAQTFNGMNGATDPHLNDADRNGTIFDANGNIETNEVIGGTSNFGQITARPDPNLARGYNWEYSAQVQHEVMARTSVTVGFYHRDFYNLQVADNQNVTTADWTQLSIGVPTDTRLPLSGTALPLYTLNPTKVGIATDNLLTYSTQNKSTYNGFEVSANVRRDRFILFGGVTTDRLVTSNCDGSSLDGRNIRPRQPERSGCSATR
jgi:hypothetical protein